MLKLILIYLFFVFSCFKLSYSQYEDTVKEPKSVFISLTRRPEPVKNLLTNISVIESKEIKQHNYTNVSETLDNITGIDIGKYGSLGAQTSVRIRNSTSEQVLVLINGIPLKGISLGSANLSELPTENIDRIEVINGPNSVLYGANAVGGVVNIITKKPESTDPVFEYNIDYSNFNTQIFRCQFELQKDIISTFISASNQKSDGFRKNSMYDNKNFYFFIETDLNRNNKLSFTGQYSYSKVGVPGPNITGLDSSWKPIYTPIDKYDGYTELIAQTTNAKQIDTETLLNLTYEGNLFSEIKLNTKLFTTINDHDYNQPDTDFVLFLNSESTKMNNKTSGLDLQLDLPSDFILGCTLHKDYYDSWQYSAYITSVDQTTTTKKDSMNTALYCQKSFNFSKLKLIPGLRYDTNNIFGTQIIPRIMGILSLTDKLNFSLSIGKSFRAPTFDELYWPDTGFIRGNPELKPETSYGYDFGTEYNDETKTIKLTYFRREISDQIRWYPIDPTDLYSPWIPSNVDIAISDGLELYLHHDITPKLNYTVNWAYVNNILNKKGEEGWQLAAYSPKNNFNLGLEYYLLKNINFIFSIKYVDKQYSADNEKGIKLPEYTLYNLQFTHMINHFLEYFIKIENITDTRYITRLGYPLPGRIYSTGLKIKF